MSLAVFIAAVVGLHLALTSTAEAQLRGLYQTVPYDVHRPVFGPRMGAAAGPGSGVLSPGEAGYGANSRAGYGAARQMATSQLHFAGPEGMTVHWDVFMPGTFDSEDKICPFKQNFMQGAIYRLRLTNVPARDNIYYPTIEVAATMARSQAFLAHNSIPVEFTDNDFDQVDSGNFVTKVIYLPDPEFQGLAMAGVGTLVNTQLEPGADPITEADNRGSILVIIRLGNKDLSEPDVVGGTMGMPGPAGFGVHGIPQNSISGVNAPNFGSPRTQTNAGAHGPAFLPAAEAGSRVGAPESSSIASR
ncbi:MAG: hypothetical protein FWD31_01040 [Planctomycetaceae bacterium]|nr:hypothetical protein [Planctomycetaceae bacterium]